MTIAFKSHKFSLLSVAILSAVSTQTFAAGFKLLEQSTSALGNAYAGRGAQITDASVAFTNPAALAKLSKEQWVFGLNVAAIDGEYSNATATSAPGLRVSGATSDQLSNQSLIPHFHYATPINDKFSFGFSVGVPYGTSSNYEDDFIGRYFAQQTEFKILALKPSISYQINDDLSIGAGVALNFATGTLSKLKDHSGLCELGAAINPSYGLLSGGTFNDVDQPAFCDSFYEVQGTDVKPSFTLGLHYQLTQATNIALSYQSEVNYTLQGDSTITNTPITGAFAPYSPMAAQYWTAPTIAGVSDGAAMPVVDITTGQLAIAPLTTEKSQLGLDTPQSVIASVDSQMTDKLSLQFSATWTQWSILQTISVLSIDEQPSMSLSTQQADNLNAPGHIGYIPEYWSDTWAFALGATYKLNNQWTIKSGIAQDNSPVNADYRSARIPANDRSWLTVGANYQPNAPWSIDVAAGLMYMKETTVVDAEYNAQDEVIYNSSFSADYSINAYVLSVQFNYPL